MEVDIPNDFTPLSLEALAMQFVVNNFMETIAKAGAEENEVVLRDGITLAHPLADIILQKLIESLKPEISQIESKSVKMISYLRAFLDPAKCSLRKLRIRSAPISDTMLQTLLDICSTHKITDIDLTYSSDMCGNEKDHTPPCNHPILLPSLLMKVGSKSLKSLILHHTMLAYSVHQISLYRGRKCRENVVYQSKADPQYIPVVYSAENSPNLTVLDVADTFQAWFITIDPINPPPLQSINLDGYHDVRVSSSIKELLEQLLEGGMGRDPVADERDKNRLTVAYSKSAIKLQTYRFFDLIDSKEPMLSDFRQASNIAANLKILDEVHKSTAFRDPSNNFVLQQWNLPSIKNTLQSLSLYNTWLSSSDITDCIFQLKQLEHLDVSWPSKRGQGSVRFRPNDFTVWIILDNLPKLKSLDVSGTSYGQNLFEDAIVDNEMQQKRSLKVPPDFNRMPLDFLGLWGTKACKLEGLDRLALYTTGTKSEMQLLKCLEMYLDRGEIISDCLSELSTLQQQGLGTMPNRTLELVMKCVSRYPTSSTMMFSCAANFYFITQAQIDVLKKSQKRDIINSIMRILQKNPRDDNLVRNSLVTFFNFDLPGDFLFDFDNFVTIFLDLFDKQRNAPEINVTVGNLCTALASTLDAESKPRMQKLPYVKTMIDIIEDRILTNEGDEVLETAWSALWNVTDESPCNAEDVVRAGAVQLFIDCYEKFGERDDLVRNMMGLSGNLSEVAYLRHHLVQENYLKLIIELVLSKQSGIEVSYNACTILSNLLSDDSDILKDVDLAQIRSRMQEAILSWDMDAARNINYNTFAPLFRILRSPREEVAHLWVTWGVNNLCDRGSKYVKMVIEEGGVALMKSVMQNAEMPQIKEFTRAILEKCEKAGSTV